MVGLRPRQGRRSPRRWARASAPRAARWGGPDLRGRRDGLDRLKVRKPGCSRPSRP